MNEESSAAQLRPLVRALAFSAVVFWGASFAATKVALNQISPIQLVFSRTSIGIVVLALVALATSSWQVRLSIRWWQLLILGFSGVAFHQWIQALGLQTTSTTSTGWIIATIPIFVGLLGWRFLGERMPPVRVAGIVFGAIGVIIVISGGQIRALFEGLTQQVGNAFILLSALNWAVFTVISKRWLFGRSITALGEKSGRSRTFPELISAMFLLMVLGWGIMLPGALGEAASIRLNELSASTINAVLFLGIACSGLAYIFWYAALTRLGATETSALLYFEPLVTQAVAWVYLGEPLTLIIVLGGAAILVGVWMVGRG